MEAKFLIPATAAPRGASNLKSQKSNRFDHQLRQNNNLNQHSWSNSKVGVTLQFYPAVFGYWMDRSHFQVNLSI